MTNEEKIQQEQAEEVKEEACEAAEPQTEEPEAEPAKDPEEEALNAKYLRLMADFQNYRRRTEKEKNDIYAFANEKIVSELLNVIDNFERALAAAAEGDSFAEGMKLIFKQLQGYLKSPEWLKSKLWVRILIRTSTML